jgi:hypothetical protein
MAKKLVLVLVLAMIVAGGAFAEWYNSYAPGIDKSSVLINAGIGLGFASSMYSGASMGLPPISAAVDFKLPVAAPITLGALGTFSTYTWGSTSYTYTLTNIGLGARGNYHFNFVKNLDVYGGLTLGYITATVTSSHGGSASIGDFWAGAQIGARYFFTDMIGAYLELGYNALQVAGVGITVKF